MGALRVLIDVVNDHGVFEKGKNRVTQLFIWRTEAKVTNDDHLEYYAARVAPADMETEYIEERSFSGENFGYSYISTPHVKFMHKYSDGAELCIARAIIALQEAGMNV